MEALRAAASSGVIQDEAHRCPKVVSPQLRWRPRRRQRSGEWIAARKWRSGADGLLIGSRRETGDRAELSPELDAEAERRRTPHRSAASDGQ
eukprot:4270549-Pleurochrysis_carterae.AAC.1